MKKQDHDLGFTIRSKHGQHDEVYVYHDFALGRKAKLMIDLLLAWTAGDKSDKLLSPKELVRFAHAVADLAVEDMKSSTWLLKLVPPPGAIATPEQMIADAARTAARSTWPDFAE